jgi:hypothetical protein
MTKTLKFQAFFKRFTDNTGTLINDMKAYLDAAKARNILVIFVLWNGAVMNNQVEDELNQDYNYSHT